MLILSSLRFFSVACIFAAVFSHKAIVYRITPKSDQQVKLLHSLWKYSDAEELDFWEPPRRINDSVEVLVMPKFGYKFRNLMRNHSFEPQILISDVQKFINQRKTISDVSLNRTKRSVQEFNFEAYHTYDSMLQFLTRVNEEYPNLTRLVPLGITHQDRPIQAIEVSFPKTYLLDKRPIVWIDAGLHAREWAAPHSALYFIHTLVTNYELDDKITDYIKKIRWVILPMANPDGYEVTQKNTIRHALWRKNKSPKICYWTTRKHCCSGVDLNRNFDAFWGGPDSEREPCSEVFRGNFSFSEPETQAIRDYIEPRRENVAAYITMHTYSQLWGYSSSAKTSYYPSDRNHLDTVAQKSVAALKRMYGTKFEVGSAADLLYPASGTAMDWAKEKMKIKYAYLLELRPDRFARQQFRAFFLHEKDLLPTAKETWEGVKAVADAVLKEA